MIRALRLESDTAGDLCVGPDFALDRLNDKDVIVKMHLVFFYSLSNALVLSCQSSDSSKIIITDVKRLLTFIESFPVSCSAHPHHRSHHCPGSQPYFLPS